MSATKNINIEKIRGLSKTNLSGTTAPTSTDDINAGYDVGSFWVDTVADKVYFCVDSTASNAVWIDVTASGDTPTFTRTFTLDAPTGTDDVTVFRTDVDITVEEIIAVSVGTTPSTTYQLKHSTDRSAVGNNLTTSSTTTSTSTGDTATLSNNIIPADSFIWFESTAASGTDVILSIDIRYTYTTPTLNRTFTLEAPTASDDVTIFRTDVDITVQEVIAVNVGTTPSTTYQLKHSTDRSAVGNNLTTSSTTTSITTGDVATLSDATIPANSFIWFESTAASGTDVILSIDIRYTED